MTIRRPPGWIPLATGDNALVSVSTYYLAQELMKPSSALHQLTVVNVGAADRARRRRRQGVTRLRWLGLRCLSNLARRLRDRVRDEAESLRLESVGLVDAVTREAPSWVGVERSMDEDSVTRDLSSRLAVLGIH